MSTAAPATPRPPRTESVLQVAILVLVAGMAGAASFTHVHDWTMANSPSGTGHWFGWANAVISELTPTAALLDIRRRRATGRPVGYPLTVLVAAALLSVTAQVAQATPTPAGWTVAALPALALLALVKMVLPGSAPAAVEDRPEPVPTPSPAVPSPSPAVPVPAPVVSQPAGPVPPMPPELLDRAHRAAVDHHATTGRPITRDALRETLRVSNATASDLLRHVATVVPAPSRTVPAVLNGQPVVAT